MRTSLVIESVGAVTRLGSNVLVAKARAIPIELVDQLT